MKTVLFIGLTLASAMASACDTKNAQVSMETFAGMGKAQQASFHWSAATQTMAERMRATLMETYAKADGCIHGKPRVLDFYVGPKLIGKVGTDGFFVPTDPAYDLPPKPGLHFWFKSSAK